MSNLDKWLTGLQQALEYEFPDVLFEVSMSGENYKVVTHMLEGSPDDDRVRYFLKGWDANTLVTTHQRLSIDHLL